MTNRDIFTAIADPTRRAIIALLAAQALTPGALAAHFHTSRQAISKHLQVLSECELITPQQQGREIIYRLEAVKLQELDQWVAQFRKLWQDKFEQLDDLLFTLQKPNNAT